MRHFYNVFDNSFLRSKKGLWYFIVFHIFCVLFTPKLLIVYPVYLSELLIIPISLFVWVKIGLQFTSLERTYLYYCLYCFLSFLLFAFIYKTYDERGLLILIKYTLFIFVVPLLKLSKSYLTVENLIWIIYLISSIIICYAIFVGANIYLSPEKAFEYVPKYSLTGFTGFVITTDGLLPIGTRTTIQVSVLLGLLFSLHIGLFFTRGKIYDLIISLLLIFAELLTLSRTGLLVVFFSSISIIIDFYKTNRFQITALAAAVIFILIISFTNFLTFLKSFGTVGKICYLLENTDVSYLIRISYINKGMDFLVSHPISFIFGTGSGGTYSKMLIGTDHLESLFFTTLFQNGLIGVALLCYFFFLCWRRAKNIADADKSFIGLVYYGMKIFIPGYFFANVIGGNSLQTDFIAPLFFFIMGYAVISPKKGTV